MADDWNTVTVIGNRGGGRGGSKSAGAVNAARRRGDAVNTEQKYGAGQNKHTGTYYGLFCEYRSRYFLKLSEINS